MSGGTIPPDDPHTRFLSVEECTALAHRMSSFAMGGGKTSVTIESAWTGATRWARNQVRVASDVRNSLVTLVRSIQGAQATVVCNQTDDTDLEAACRRAERLLLASPEQFDWKAVPEYTETFPRPNIWSEATYNLDAEARADAMRTLIAGCEKAGMRAAGDIRVRAIGRAVMSDQGRALYYPFTHAEYSVTVRDPSGTGSGWAGKDHYDWARIDASALTERALDKCLRSRNPVAVEPGRYTAILEPQAVSDLCSWVMGEGGLGRQAAESAIGVHPFRQGVIEITPGRFAQKWGVSRIGERVIDERLTISADPMDADLGFPPFQYTMSARDERQRLQVFHQVDWIKNGVLKNLAYDTAYGIEALGVKSGEPTSGGFRMNGGTTSIDEMIQTTERGLLVTRLADTALVDQKSWMISGYTRDGLWLIEKGKIAKAVKNFRFTESPLFVLNQVEQIGVAERVYHPWNYSGVICPALKVRDFSFTQLFDAV